MHNNSSEEGVSRRCSDLSKKKKRGGEVVKTKEGWKKGGRETEKGGEGGMGEGRGEREGWREKENSNSKTFILQGLRDRVTECWGGR